MSAQAALINIARSLHPATGHPNRALDVRGTALFDGVYRMRDGLMVRLDPRRLRPSHLAECGLFGVAKNTRYGEPR